MKIKIKILRKRDQESASYWQTFWYETENEKATVAQALEELNQRNPLIDVDGKEAEPIAWECNCLQKKCGACGMLVNGFPVLACDDELSNYVGSLELKPFQKFSVIKDLVVDREPLYKNLKKMKVWLKDNPSATEEKKQEEVYEASQCLQCGCCLEICTSYVAGNDFYGMASMVPAVRVLGVEKGQKEILQSYVEHIQQGCENYNACEHVCPAQLPLTQMMAHVNRMTCEQRM